MGKITPDNVPAHVAIIMDGNGRWARAHNLPKIMGHREGVKTVEKILEASRDAGVKILTLYVFSTENWKRPKREVMALMNLLEARLDKFTEKLKKEGVKLNVIGDMSALSPNVRKKLFKAIELTKANSAFTLNLAINYGARKEILDAAKAVSRAAREGALDIDSLTEDDFSRYLYTKGMPDPDLLIRTSGEMRVSNFLLWQISYAEIYVTKKTWPDFGKKDFLKAIEVYGKRDRRFGGR